MILREGGVPNRTKKLQYSRQTVMRVYWVGTVATEKGTQNHAGGRPGGGEAGQPGGAHTG